ncbi:MAG: sodium/proline symporter, partial [Myxococcota bacterium]
MSATLIGFIVYLVVVVIAGALTYRLTQTQSDFLLAGRKLNVWVATMSERASAESSWLLLGLPAVALASGLQIGWTALGCVIGIGASWSTVAKRLREQTEASDALTLPEFLAKRFGDKAGGIRLVASLIILFFYSFYVGAQFSGAGKVLNATFGIDINQGMLLGAGIIIAYTMAGGFFAVAWTDFVQAFLMLGTLVV